MLDSGRETTLADLAPLGMTIAKVAGGVLLLAQGNIIMLLGGYWWWSQRKKRMEAEVEQ